MAELSDAFIALPGGLGTLEELLEMATLSQLGDHANRASKPCGVLNIDGFFDSLFALLQTACDAGFMKLEHVRMIESHDQPNALLDSLQNWNPSSQHRIQVHIHAVIVLEYIHDLTNHVIKTIPYH